MYNPLWRHVCAFITTSTRCLDSGEPSQTDDEDEESNIFFDRLHSTTNANPVEKLQGEKTEKSATEEHVIILY